MEKPESKDISSGARAQRLARRRINASLHQDPSTPAAEGGGQVDAALSLPSRDVFGGTEAHTHLPAAPGRDLPSAREDPESSEPQERAPNEHEPRRDGSSEGRRALSSPGRRGAAHDRVADPQEQTRPSGMEEKQATGGRGGSRQTEDGGYSVEGAGGDGGPAATLDRAGTARTERTGGLATTAHSTASPSTERVSEGRVLPVGAVTVTGQVLPPGVTDKHETHDGLVLPPGVTDKHETHGGQVLPPGVTDKHETHGGQVLPPGGIMGTGQTREAAAAKQVINGEESKGQRVEKHSGGVRQVKHAWSAHGAGNAAGVPLPTSADGKWGPEEEHAATVVRGQFKHAAKEGRDSWDVRPPPGSESDSSEGETTAEAPRTTGGLRDTTSGRPPLEDESAPGDSGEETAGRQQGSASGGHQSAAGTEYHSRAPNQNVSMISESGDEADGAAGPQRGRGARNGNQGSERGGEQGSGDRAAPGVSITASVATYARLFTAASTYHVPRPGSAPLSLGDGLFTELPIGHNVPILSNPGEVITTEQYGVRARDGYGGYAVQLNSEYCVDGHQAHHDGASLAGYVNSPYSAVTLDPAVPAVAAVANAHLVVRCTAVGLYSVTIVSGSAEVVAEDAERTRDGLAAISRPPIPRGAEILMDYSAAYIFPTALTDSLPPMDISAAEEVRVMFAAGATADDWATRAPDDPTDSAYRGRTSARRLYGDAPGHRTRAHTDTSSLPRNLPHNDTPIYSQLENAFPHLGNAYAPHTITAVISQEGEGDHSSSEYSVGATEKSSLCEDDQGPSTWKPWEESWESRHDRDLSMDPNLYEETLMARTIFTFPTNKTINHHLTNNTSIPLGLGPETSAYLNHNNTNSVGGGVSGTDLNKAGSDLDKAGSDLDKTPIPNPYTNTLFGETTLQHLATGRPGSHATLSRISMSHITLSRITGRNASSRGVHLDRES
ncbi:hypothetical protein B484DRAFT_469414 [Ochromonadaceae sp. CCMP2298]|nr:hypothetical protein B484DRAFT_469414 [Ochromonadaceae sp. CCMP2298]